MFVWNWNCHWKIDFTSNWFCLIISTEFSIDDHSYTEQGSLKIWAYFAMFLIACYQLWIKMLPISPFTNQLNNNNYLRIIEIFWMNCKWKGIIFEHFEISCYTHLCKRFVRNLNVLKCRQLMWRNSEAKYEPSNWKAFSTLPRIQFSEPFLFLFNKSEWVLT